VPPSEKKHASTRTVHPFRHKRQSDIRGR
jgi:hypothetical protein